MLKENLNIVEPYKTKSLISIISLGSCLNIPLMFQFIIELIIIDTNTDISKEIKINLKELSL